MKKILIFLMLCISIEAYAKELCLYNDVQTTIRNAEYVKDVERLRKRKEALNEDYSCQTPFQLAILRGNYSILYQLMKFGLDANKPVPMAGFNPDGEYPDKIPPILFAARFASRGELIQVLLDEGIDPKVKDANGHDFFWYLDQNPVLRHTYISEGGYKYLVPGGMPEDEIEDLSIIAAEEAKKTAEPEEEDDEDDGAVAAAAAVEVVEEKAPVEVIEAKPVSSAEPVEVEEVVEIVEEPAPAEFDLKAASLNIPPEDVVAEEPAFFNDMGAMMGE